MVIFVLSVWLYTHWMPDPHGNAALVAKGSHTSDAHLINRLRPPFRGDRYPSHKISRRNILFCEPSFRLGFGDLRAATRQHFPYFPKGAIDTAPATRSDCRQNE